MSRRQTNERRIGGPMYFTEGRLQEYEREMQAVPGYTESPMTTEDRECPYCLYWDEKYKICKEHACIVFG